MEKPRQPPAGAQGTVLGLWGVLDRGCLHKGWGRGTLGWDRHLRAVLVGLETDQGLPALISLKQASRESSWRQRG